jgi:hypothetical protein
MEQENLSLDGYLVKNEDALYVEMRVRGGGKRAKTASITDFAVKEGDPLIVQSALRMRMPLLAEFVAAAPMGDIYEYVKEQRNGDRIVLRFCSAFVEYDQVQDDIIK